MIISLTGFMGCGKSSVGRLTAGLLGWDFIDLDEYIVHKKGRSIPEIFSREGEETFRAIEAEAFRDVVAMREMAGLGNLVLALGGGTLTMAPIREQAFAKTRCVYLRTRLDTIVARLGRESSDRPLFKAHDLERLYEGRLGIYALAPYVVDTDGLTPEELARKIADLSGNW